MENNEKKKKTKKKNIIMVHVNETIHVNRICSKLSNPDLITYSVHWMS